MKKTFLAIILSSLALSSVAHAEYVYKLPLEIKNGGSLPNGTISFTNKAELPAEPSEPEVEEPQTPEPEAPTEPVEVDPFEPENPACDPNDQTYPGTVTGKELVWDDGFTNEDGTSYRSCKLKETDDSNILARYVSGIDAGSTSTADSCNPSSSNTAVSTGSCRVAFTYFTVPFTVFSNGLGGYSYANQPVKFFMPSKATFSYDDIGRIDIDGHTCSNLRQYVIATFPTVRYGSDRICDLDTNYETLRDKIGKPFIVTIYKK